MADLADRIEADDTQEAIAAAQGERDAWADIEARWALRARTLKEGTSE